MLNLQLTVIPLFNLSPKPPFEDKTLSHLHPPLRVQLSVHHCVQRLPPVHIFHQLVLENPLSPDFAMQKQVLTLCFLFPCIYISCVI